MSMTFLAEPDCTLEILIHFTILFLLLKVLSFALIHPLNKYLYLLSIMYRALEYIEVAKWTVPGSYF